MTQDTSAAQPPSGRSRVFAKTPKGVAAVRGVTPELSRSHRQLLMAVDGRTPSWVFQTMLPNFGDVDALLDALCAQGYVVDTLGVTQARSSPTQPATRPPPSPAFSNLFADTVPDGWATTTQSLTRPMPMQPGPAQLRAAVALMAVFLKEHLPACADEAIASLQRTDSVETFLSSLPHYQRLISPTGLQAHLHLAEVRAVLCS